ncbi:branched-chain alpha-keto acid dehydrogenase [Bacillus manliponensis]|uniref:Gamma-glutamylcyclotransferase family protein n=1 Tax=Bacillus manliponensis TaxID=574376 RepID=A0A073JXN4_9BACI|nr:gamma-glutamylcyclotransferase family protein [Bacillus manliponensis]KEK19779.1 branched-chain alpha-keto acid dehydrogenase [Bacillus manliponensis]
MHYVFVYGTLREEETNAHFLKGATYIEKDAWIYGLLFDTNEGYPAMILPSDQKVFGEVYEVDDVMLQALDELEEYTGNPKEDLYDRSIQTIYIGDKTLQAYVYTAQQQDILKIPIVSGDWVLYRKSLCEQS